LSDPFSSTSSSFINMDDLKGRTLLIRPDEIGSRDSKTTGKPYEYVVCDVVILTGDTDDKIEAVPGLYEGIQLTGGSVVGHLRPKVGKRANGARKLALQTVGQVPSTKRGQQDAWVLELVDDPALISAAREYLAKDETILAKGVQETDAFA
jgi:hypothetical protein